MEIAKLEFLKICKKFFFKKPVMTILKFQFCDYVYYLYKIL